MNTRRCFIRIGDEHLKESAYVSSLSEAKARFKSVAKRLKIPLVARVYYIDDNTTDSVSMFPDVQMHFDDKGKLVVEELTREDVSQFGTLS